MQQSKVVQTLKPLTPWQWNHLKDFIDSPFHNKNEKVKSFFYYLRSHRNQLSSSAINREYIYREIFGKEEYDEQKLFNIASLLRRKVNEFFSFSTYRNRKADQLIHLLEDQVVRRDWAAFPNSIAQIQKLAPKIDSTGSFSFDFYAYRAGMMQLKKDSETQRLSSEAFYSTIGYLDRFYLGSRLQLACEYLNRGHVINLDDSMILNIDPMINHFLKMEGDNSEDASLQMYSSIYRMLSQPDQKECFLECVNLLQRGTKLSQANLRDGTTYCINYCIRRINSGSHDFLSQLFDLYTWAIEKEVLMEEGLLGEWHFKNIVQTAIRHGRLEWIDQFVATYSQYLPKQVRENAYAFNQASIYFEQKAYSAAKKLLLKVQFTDIFYSLDSKVLLVKIYYEENDMTPLYSLLRSLSVFLRRKSTLSSSQRSIYINFIKATNLLAEAKEGKDYLQPSVFLHKLEKLKQIEVTSPNMAQFNWYRAKVELLS